MVAGLGCLIGLLIIAIGGWVVSRRHIGPIHVFGRGPAMSRARLAAVWEEHIEATLLKSGYSWDPSCLPASTGLVESRLVFDDGTTKVFYISFGHSRVLLGAWDFGPDGEDRGKVVMCNARRRHALENDEFYACYVLQVKRAGPTILRISHPPVPGCKVEIERIVYTGQAMKHMKAIYPGEVDAVERVNRVVRTGPQPVGPVGLQRTRDGEDDQKPEK